MHPLVLTKQDLPAVAVGTVLSALCSVPLLLAATATGPPPVAGHHAPRSVHSLTTPPSPGQSSHATQPPGSGSTGIVTVSRHQAGGPSPAPNPSPSPSPSGVPSQLPTSPPDVVVAVSPACVQVLVLQTCVALALGG